MKHNRKCQGSPLDGLRKLEDSRLVLFVYFFMFLCVKNHHYYYSGAYRFKNSAALKMNKVIK